MPTAATIRAEIREKIHQLAHTSTEPSVKGRLNSLARHLKMPVGRVADYWYGEVRCPPAHEADQIRSYYAEAQELIEARKCYEELHQNFVRDHPRLARVVPRPSRGGKILAEARAAAASDLSRRRGRK